MTRTPMLLPKGLAEQARQIGYVEGVHFTEVKAMPLPPPPIKGMQTFTPKRGQTKKKAKRK